LVYRMKDDRFPEVIVDHKAGKIGEGGAHLGWRASHGGGGAERNHGEGQALWSMHSVRGREGEQGLSCGQCHAGLQDGHPVTDVTLVKGDRAREAGPGVRSQECRAP
jgi:hypothetical protein